MASVYQEQNTGSQSSSTSLASSIAGKVSGTTTGSSKSSASTKTTGNNSYIKQVNSALNYAPKFDENQYDSVVSAKNYLNDVIANKPGSYQSKYTSQLDDLYNQLLNRGQFTYDMNGDALYDQYRQRYTAQGVKSMRDTMGQAAANTGGYGSSYAQTAGQDAYNSYMAQLQNAIPELHSSAQQRFNDNTTALTNKYNLVNNAEQTDYSRYRDDVSDFQYERNYAANQYDSAYNKAYTKYSDRQNMGMSAAGNQRQEEANDKASAQNLVSTMISAGAKPSKALMQQAGYSENDVLALYKKVK